MAPTATDVSLTGTLTDDQGTLLNGTLTFLLSGFGSIMPRISNTQLIPGLSFQVTVTNGVFTTSFYSNQIIIPGPMVTFYSVSYQPAVSSSQTFTFAQNYSFPAGTFNLAQLTPIGPAIGVPVATIPTSLPANVKSQIFTSGGTFIIPAINVKAIVVGAGGAGGGAPRNAIDPAGGGGGGSGAVSIKYLTGLTLGKTLSVAIGSGGVGANIATGGNGTDSTVSSGTQSITTIDAPGGLGGGAGGQATHVAFGGSGGVQGTGGDINSGGNNGQNGDSNSNSGGGGGAGLFGGGAPLLTPGNIGGNPGTGPGAGGGGAVNGAFFGSAGGNGSDGIVIFEWVG